MISKCYAMRNRPRFFAAALSGKDGRAPGSADADQPLERMVAAIRAGRLDGLIAFDRTGDAVNVG